VLSLVASLVLCLVLSLDFFHVGGAIMSHKNCPTKLQVSNLAKDTTHREMY
jgi:hypothetical protein